ncbi:MAG: FAD-dependent monooxygenase [Rickettsiales bacterium]|nr:FAD-dependent monooxygenase [Rickettsiales bacterium]
MNQITIYGGGFSGITACLALSSFVSKILFIEPFSLTEKKRNGRDDRTTALSAGSVEFLKEYGIWPEIEQIAGVIQDIKIVDNDLYSGDSLLKLDFHSKDISEKPMGYIVENNLFREILIKKIKSLPNVEILEGVKIDFLSQDNSSVTLKLSNNNEVQTKILLAVDGKNSPIRQKLNIETTDKDYNQNAITFCIKHQKPHRNTAVERFTPTGPFALLPLKENDCSAVVWTIPRNLSEIYMNMNEERFKQEIYNRMQDYGEFEIIGEKNSYPLKLKFSKKYYSGRVVFAGDSAHSIHPIAGQGFNQGVRDLILLAKLFKERSRLGLDLFDEETLNNYEKSRFADNMQMILATDKINSLFSNESKVLRFARRVGISAVDKLPPLKKFFIKRASGSS